MSHTFTLGRAKGFAIALLTIVLVILALLLIRWLTDPLDGPFAFSITMAWTPFAVKRALVNAIKRKKHKEQCLFKETMAIRAEVSLFTSSMLGKMLCGAVSGLRGWNDFKHKAWSGADEAGVENKILHRLRKMSYNDFKDNEADAANYLMMLAAHRRRKGGKTCV